VAAPLREVLAGPVALSVIVPTLNEEYTIGRLLGDLCELDIPHEVIVTDGGSGDQTTAVAIWHGAHVLRACRGRGSQLAAGARAASAPVLCFLHADVRLHDNARRELADVARTRRPGAFAFRFRIDARGWQYRLIEFGARLRMWLFHLSYGDQGLVVSRADYEAAGGYPDFPIFEDVALVDALRRITTIRSLRSDLPVSARRWEREGPFRRVLRNWRIIIAYRLGASPHQLAARYRPHDDSPVRDATASHRG
jgi:rSAM/selenodomain-associated transferase 2